MVEPVGVGGEQYALHDTGAPVAVEPAEEHLAEAPLRADVRLGGPPRELAVLLAEPVGVILEPRVEVGVGHGDHRSEIELQRQATVHVAVLRPGGARAGGIDGGERVAFGVRRGGEPQVPV